MLQANYVEFLVEVFELLSLLFPVKDSLDDFFPILLEPRKLLDLLVLHLLAKALQVVLVVPSELDIIVLEFRFFLFAQANFEG